MISVQRVLLCVAALLGVLIPGSAIAAAEYPSRPVTIVVPWPPGAGVDAVARILQAKLSESLKQAVVIENRPGSAGNSGAAAALRAQPDGYTLLLSINATLVMNPFLYRSFPFDPKTAMVGISQLAEGYMGLAVSASSPIKSVADLVAEAKKEPGKLSYGSAGYGSGHHLAGEMLNRNAGIRIIHVPFPGTASAVTNVLGGHLSMTYATLPALLPFVQSRQLRIIAVAQDQRVQALPDVPTIGETVPGVTSSSWYGLFAPAGTPRPVIERLYAAVRFALADPETRTTLEAAGFSILGGTPAELDERVKADLKTWGTTIPSLGIEMN